MKESQTWMQTRINLIKVTSWMVLMLTILICVVVVTYVLATDQSRSRLAGEIVNEVALAIILISGVGGIVSFVTLQNLAALLQTILNIEINTQNTSDAVEELSGAVDRLVYVLEQRANNPQVGGP